MNSKVKNYETKKYSKLLNNDTEKLMIILTQVFLSIENITHIVYLQKKQQIDYQN